MLNETDMALPCQTQAERSWTPRFAAPLNCAVGAQLALS